MVSSLELGPGFGQFGILDAGLTSNWECSIKVIFELMVTIAILPFV